MKTSIATFSTFGDLRKKLGTIAAAGMFLRALLKT